MSNERDRMLDMITEMSNKNAEKDQRIAELEEELAELKANAVVPKFKVGDEIYIIRKFARDIKKTYIKNIFKGRIDGLLRIRTGSINGNNVTKKTTDIFKTKEEAQQKLKELEGK